MPLFQYDSGHSKATMHPSHARTCDTLFPTGASNMSPLISRFPPWYGAPRRFWNLKSILAHRAALFVVSVLSSYVLQYQLIDCISILEIFAFFVNKDHMMSMALAFIKQQFISLEKDQILHSLSFANTGRNKNSKYQHAQYI